MGTKKKPTPNDQRSNVKNPEHAAYEADRQNRIKQGHANVPTRRRRPRVSANVKNG
jgi:hypothetical protein